KQERQFPPPGAKRRWGRCRRQATEGAISSPRSEATLGEVSPPGDGGGHLLPQERSDVGGGVAARRPRGPSPPPGAKRRWGRCRRRATEGAFPPPGAALPPPRLRRYSPLRVSCRGGVRRVMGW